MHNRSYISSPVDTLKKSSLNNKPASEKIAKIFHTAIALSKNSNRNFSKEIKYLTETPAFQVMLEAIQQLALLQNISETQAADQFIQTFRKLDDIWGSYFLQEGLSKVRKPN